MVWAKNTKRLSVIAVMGVLLLGSLSLGTSVAHGDDGDAVVGVNGPYDSPGPYQVPYEPAVDGGGVLIVDDSTWFPFWVAQEAATNLGIPHTFTTDRCATRQAAASGSYDAIVVNSQFFALSFCTGGADVYDRLADFAQAGGTVVVQSWEVGQCAMFNPCTPESVDRLLEAVGSDGTVFELMHWEPATIATASDGLCLDMLLPNVFLPFGMHGTEPTPARPFDFFIQGVAVGTGDGQKCFESQGHPTQGLVVSNGEGAWVGFLPSNYWDVESGTLYDGVDVVAIYENLFVHLGLGL